MSDQKLLFCSEKREVTDSPSEMRRMVSANRKATDNWRIFAVGDWNFANPPEGNVQRVRAGGGLDWRIPDLDATAFFTQSWGTLPRAGGGATLDWVAARMPVDLRHVVVLGQGIGGYVALRAVRPMCLPPPLRRSRSRSTPPLAPRGGPERRSANLRAARSALA